MRKYFNLTKRNCLVFLRDRSAVFFSLLSMLIVLMLMGIFLARMNVDSVTDLLNTYGGVRDAALDKEHATQLVQYWTLAGILVVNSLTVTLTVIGTMISDQNEHRLESFYAAPVKKAWWRFLHFRSGGDRNAFLPSHVFRSSGIYRDRRRSDAFCRRSP